MSKSVKAVHLEVEHAKAIFVAGTGTDERPGLKSGPALSNRAHDIRGCKTRGVDVQADGPAIPEHVNVVGATNRDRVGGQLDRGLRAIDPMHIHGPIRSRERRIDS